VANRVIGRVRERDPPGRYLEAVNGDKKARFGYQDAQARRIFEKTCQALREKKWKNTTRDYVETIVSRSYSLPKVAIKEFQTGGNQTESSDDDEIPETSSGSDTIAKELDKVQRGSSISVYWPLDKVYYKAKVHDRRDGRVLLEYTDGVQEWITLSEHEIKVEES